MKKLLASATLLAVGVGPVDDRSARARGVQLGEHCLLREPAGELPLKPSTERSKQKGLEIFQAFFCVCSRRRRG